MEGVQHNTMDVEYYGPEPADGGLVSGRAAGRRGAGRAAGDQGFAGQLPEAVRVGSRWIDENLFNGYYYRHVIRAVAGAEDIAPGLRHQSMGSADTVDPDLQLGDGCLVDQLVGQYAAGWPGSATCSTRPRDDGAAVGAQPQLPALLRPPLQPHAQLRARRRGRRW